MKILVSHDGAGCGYVRLIQPLRELAKHGHEVKFITTRDMERLTKAHDYDVVVGQRFAGYDGMSLWRRARTPNNRLVYETDDDLFSIDMANWAAYTEFNKWNIQEAIKGYCELSDLVTVTTETLAKVHREELGNKNVAVLHNCIPEYLLELPRKPAGNRRPRLGWVGGASHGVDIHQATAAVRRFLNKNDGWDLYVGGTDYRPSFNARNYDQMLYADWKQINEDERGYYELIDFEIGLAPVKDTKFSRSKSALKALEYGARGIPVVASDVQPYREYITHGENGFLAKDEHEWMKYIRLLATDGDLREQMGANAKQKAQYYTHENNWQKWEAAYEGLF